MIVTAPSNRSSSRNGSDIGTLTNRAGRTVSMVCVSVTFPYLDLPAARADLAAGRQPRTAAVAQVHDSPTAMKKFYDLISKFEVMLEIGRAHV